MTTGKASIPVLAWCAAVAILACLLMDRREPVPSPSFLHRSLPLVTPQDSGDVTGRHLTASDAHFAGDGAVWVQMVDYDSRWR